MFNQLFLLSTFALTSYVLGHEGKTCYPISITYFKSNDCTGEINSNYNITTLRDKSCKEGIYPDRLQQKVKALYGNHNLIFLLSLLYLILHCLFLCLLIADVDSDPMYIGYYISYDECKANHLFDYDNFQLDEINNMKCIQQNNIESYQIHYSKC